ncbi:MAG: GNAT family N-acetyltransferase [Pseudonocardiales bacterium]
MTVTLRDMTAPDLPMLSRWLREAHVARWWSDDPAEQLAEFDAALAGDDPTHVLVVEEDGRPVGWSQWYRWADSPDEAPHYRATEDDLGMDYGIGALTDISRGVGTELIARLVQQIRRDHPQAPILVAVSTLNTASRQVLEKNGFGLVAETMIESEPGHERTALYRLAARG